jgi:hypothetical protein
MENITEKLVSLLGSTLNPNLRKQAEDELGQIHTINGFSTTLLQLVMSEQVDMPIRQAGAIYLKNMVNQFWLDNSKKNDKDITTTQPMFMLNESDKATIRDLLIEAVIHSPDPIRAQFVVCVRTVAQHDFPEKWTAIVDKVHTFIQTNDVNTWYGALQAFYQLCKIFEYKSNKERDPYHNAMRVLLPMFLERLCQLNEDPSDLSVLTQKQILKIFFTFVQFTLPLDVMTHHSIANWIEVCNMILTRPLPEHIEAIDRDERPELSWWKVKKWAVRILNRFFERYGTPTTCNKEYVEFANFFLKGYATNILSSILKVLEQYRNGVYVAPRVLQQAIIFIEYAVIPPFTWKFLKPHMLVIIQEILYPLMCHSDEDDELFENDPIEYIKAKYDVFEDFVSPVNAARQLVYQVANKRKVALDQAMVFCIQALSQQQQQLTPRQKDGILHIVGAVAPVLLKKNMYKDQVESMLVSYVFPEFQSASGFLRARACWVLKSFARIQFKSPENLVNACNNIKNCILNDTCLPVNVEACIALQEMLTEEEIDTDGPVKLNIGQHIQPLMLKMLNLIRDTENDDVSNVIQRLIYVYEDEITTFAVEIMTHLADTFVHVMKCCEQEDEDSEARDDKTITAVGILSTIDSILSVMEGKNEILAELEKLVLPVISAIIQNGLMDFYEELFSLLSTLTSRSISPNMWQMLGLIYDIFQNDAADYFTELMPVLHNYVTVDTPAFLSEPARLETVLKMVRQVLTANVDDDEAESHAAKLLEIIVLQCHGQMDSMLPSILQIVFERMARDEIASTELRTMCMQVVIAALWCNTEVVLQTLDQASMTSGRSFLLEFLQKWFNDMDCFFGLHDRKVCALGLCTLLQTAAKRPHDIAQIADKILPSTCMVLDDLEKVYAARAQEDSDDEHDYEDADSDSDETIDDDEDEQNKIEHTPSSKGDSSTDKSEESDLDDSDDEDEDDYDHTVLEDFTTVLDTSDDVDEFVIFKDTLQALQTNEPQFYEHITTSLTPEQCKSIQNFITLANKRLSEKESRKILAAGGYQFNSLNVPSNFNFGSGNNSFNSP